MAEKKFIKLHQTNGNYPIICKIDSILFVTMDEDENEDTIVHLDNEEYECFHVHESVDKIYDMIEKASSGNSEHKKKTIKNDSTE